MLGSEYDLKMCVRNMGYPLRLPIGAPNLLIRRFRNFTANFTADIFGTKLDIGLHNRPSALELLGSPISSQTVLNLGPQTAYN